MTQYDSTTLGPAIKEYYSKETVRDLVYENNPWFGMVQKERTGGKYYDFVVEYELPASRSHDVSKALANKKAGKFQNFLVTQVKDYIAISIDRQTMYATDKSEYAFFSAQTRAIDSALKNLVRSLAMGMYRNKGGARGKIGTSGISGSTITLDDIEEIANFGVGDTLVLSANDGSTSTDTLLNGGATVNVTGVNRDTGVITCSAGIVASIPAAADGNFIFKDGDFQASIAGFDSWCPTTAPTAGDSFFGADRSPDVTRLAGCRISAIGDPISEAILKGCARLGREGAMPDTVLMNNASMRDLIIELGNKVEYEVTGAEDANVGFKGVIFMTDAGKVTCYSDHNCPNKKLYITRKDVWRMVHSSVDVPEVQDEDGSALFREAGSDGFEVRMSYYCNVLPLSPQENCVVTLAA
jgi:hypothetical protein